MSKLMVPITAVRDFFASFSKEAEDRSPSPEDALPKTEDTDKLDGSEAALKPIEQEPLEGKADEDTKVKTGKPEDGRPQEKDVHPAEDETLDPVDAKKTVEDADKDIGKQTDDYTGDKGAGDPATDINVIETYRSKIAADENAEPSAELLAFVDGFLYKQSGKDERGKRDGSGPFGGSAMASIGDKGRRQQAGEKCPAKKGKDDKEKGEEKKAGKDEPGVPDGTGPAKGSFQESKGEGKKQEAGEVCPVVKAIEDDKGKSAPDGTGPAKGSYQALKGKKGKKQEAGKECPIAKKSALVKLAAYQIKKRLRKSKGEQ